MAQTERTVPSPAEQPFHLGDRIRKAREHSGIDRQTFAAQIGIHRDTLAKYEETGNAKRSALISVAWATKVRLEWLETGALPWLATPEDIAVNDVKQAHLSPITNIADWPRVTRSG